MIKIIKNDRYGLIFNDILHYSYFVHQLFFVLSASRLAREIPIVYKVMSAIMIFTFFTIALYDIYLLLKGKFKLKEIFIYAIICTALLISFINYRMVMVFANVFFISAFKETDGKRALKYYIYATVIGIITNLLLGIVTNYTGNVIQTRHGVERIRYGLGFFYTTMAPVYFSSIVFVFIALKENIRSVEYLIIIIIDFVLFFITDTKAPFTYVLLSLIVHFILTKSKNKVLFNFFGVVTIFSYVIFFFISFLPSYYYDASNRFLLMFNKILTGRLEITNSALTEFGYKFFGQTVPIVFETTSQHVDSSMISMLMLNGLLVFIISICFMTFFSYISFKAKKTTLLIALFFIAFRSSFDYGFMAMQFSPIVLLFMPTLKEYLNEKIILQKV